MIDHAQCAKVLNLYCFNMYVCLCLWMKMFIMHTPFITDDNDRLALKKYNGHMQTDFITLP